MYVGLDFGTTNSSLAAAAADGGVRLASFGAGGQRSQTFRSILYCDPLRRKPDLTPLILAGPEAIEGALGAEGRGRVILSPKSFLASRLFTRTNVYGTEFALEDLIGILIRALREDAEAQLGDLGGKVVVGRPVVFAGAEEEADVALALQRLTTAVKAAGFEEVVFEYEPVAAAYHYARRVTHETLVMIADLGGGTSDFSVVRLAPPAAASEDPACEILGTAGVAIGGDLFDGKIVRHLVSPELGRGSEYRGFNLALLPVPVWIYTSLERWHHLSFLNTRETLHMLGKILEQAVEKERIESLIEVVRNDMGYALYRAVESAKHAISDAGQSRFRFEEPPVHLEAPMMREAFEAWIREDLRAIAHSVEDLLARCGVGPGQIGRVFMTGGSSYVPAVRRLFRDKFGEDRMQGGGELTSVAEGLALRARAMFG